MQTVQAIKNLNSNESYLFAIHQVRMLERDLALAGQAHPSVDRQQVEAIRALYQVVRERTEQESTPSHLQGVHHILEEELGNLLKKVEAISSKIGIVSSLISAQSVSGLKEQMMKGGALLGTAALCGSLLYSGIPTEEEHTTTAPGGEGEKTDFFEDQTRDLQDSSQEGLEGLFSEQDNIGLKQAEELREEPLDQHIPEEIKDPVESRPEEFVNLDEQSQIDLLRGEGLPAVVDKAIDLQIAEYIRESLFLGELFLARHAMNKAYPFLSLAVLHRLYHMARLSGSSEVLKEKMPELIEVMEKVAGMFSELEKRMPFSMRDMLERMMSMDRWAVVGLIDLLRNAPGMEGLINANPVSSFLSLGFMFIPFAFGNGLFSSSPHLKELNGTTTLVSQADDKLIAEYGKDLFYLLYIALAGNALNEAAPILTVAAVHHGYQIAKLSNMTGNLTETMPLFIKGSEKISNLYSGMMPVPLSLESTTNMDTWATAGLIGLVRYVPGVSSLAGHLPMISSLSSKQRALVWNIVKFSPFLISGLLPQIGLGHHFQSQLLLH